MKGIGGVKGRRRSQSRKVEDRDAIGKLEGERPAEGGIEGGDCEREAPWTREGAAVSVCVREKEELRRRVRVDFQSS